MAASPYDRRIDDLGTIVALEHVNTTVPDQRIAGLFYLAGLGFTRDPYLMVDDENMWVNVGRQQFHLPNRSAQVLRGHVGLVVPDLDALERRLERVALKLSGTRYAYSRDEKCITTVSPWGNVIHCYAPQPCFGAMRLGRPYVAFDVPRGAAAGIQRFYARVFAVQGTLSDDGGTARIPVGPDQELLFRETDAPLPQYDRHHVAIYVSDFSGPHAFLLERGLITEESDAHQYRFQVLIDPENGAPLFEIEHEVRSLRHPLWGRAFVNRNPDQTQREYVPGRDAYAG
jgi:hypothetical protein